MPLVFHICNDIEYICDYLLFWSNSFPVPDSFFAVYGSQVTHSSQINLRQKQTVNFYYLTRISVTVK